MNPIIEAIRRVAESGVEQVAPAERKRLRLVNSACILGVFVAAPYCAIFLALGLPWLAGAIPLVCAPYVLVIMLHARGVTHWPRLLVPLTLNTSVFYYAAAFGLRVGIEWAFFSACITPFLIFERRDRRLLVLMAALPMVAFAVLSLAPPLWIPQAALAPEAEWLLRLIMIPSVGALVVLPVFFLYNENYKQEERLSFALDQVTAEFEVRTGLETQLYAKQQQLFQILEHMPLGVSVADASGAEIYANPLFDELVGERDFIGEHAGEWRNVFVRGTPEAYSAERLPMARALAGEECRVDDLDVERDGERVMLACHAAPICDDAGKLAYAMVTLEDVTARVRADQERLQGQKLESVGQLAAGVAHEINTPMQYIGDNAHFLKRAVSSVMDMLSFYEERLGSDERLAAAAKKQAKKLKLDFLKRKVPKALETSIEGVEAVSTLVRALKEFSHPGTNEKVATDLNRAIGTTLIVSRNEYKYVAEVETDFDGALPEVPCLPGEVNQVVLNMIVNAAHAIGDVVEAGSGAVGRIRVSTRHEGDWAVITIEDTGGGIPEHVRKNIFDPFFTTKEVGKGTGQGLAIAHSIIVDKHGGRIDVESELGVGTTFTIRLPLRVEADLLGAA